MNRAIPKNQVIKQASVEDTERLIADPDYHVIMARRNRLLRLAVAGVTTIAACEGSVSVQPAPTSNVGGMARTTTSLPSTGAGGSPLSSAVPTMPASIVSHGVGGASGVGGAEAGAPEAGSVEAGEAVAEAGAGDADVIDAMVDANQYPYHGCGCEGGGCVG